MPSRQPSGQRSIVVGRSPIVRIIASPTAATYSHTSRLVICGVRSVAS